MAGRPRTPTSLKVIAGTDRPDRQKATEPKPPRTRPPAPSAFPEIVRQAWDEVAALADNMGVLTDADQIALEALANALVELRTARKIVADRGGAMTYETVNGEGAVMYRAYPEMAIIADADRRVMAWVTKFGLTPADRSRVAAADRKPQNDFDSF